MTSVTFSLVNSSDRTELLKGGLEINDKKSHKRLYQSRETDIQMLYMYQNWSSDQKLQTKDQVMSEVQ